MKNPAIYAALVLNGFLLLLALLALCISLTLQGSQQLVAICLLTVLVPFAWGAWQRILYRNNACSGERGSNTKGFNKSH